MRAERRVVGAGAGTAVDAVEIEVSAAAFFRLGGMVYSSFFYFIF
jgi:hypothetical protein